MRTAPQIEAEASRLNRDYAVNKKNYEDLLARRESASISGQLEGAAGVADFRLVDPPRVAPKAVSPNRLLLLPIALLISLAAGGFTGFALSQLRPVFHNAKELRAKFGLPLLGMVSAVLNEADLRREKGDRLRFLFSSSSLVAAFVLMTIAIAIVAARRV